jgi:preprotein translocase subunit Sss1
MYKFDVISSMNYLKDTLEMIHKNGMKVQLQQNIRRWHHITSQNSRIFKNPRQEEFSKAVAKINAMGRHVFDSYEIKCPEDETYFYVLGEAYNNCLAKYRDEIIDRNGIVYCIYNRNTPDAIPEVTFEVNKDFDFIQIKTFNDEDVTDPDIIKMLKEWQKIARKGLCNG